MNSTRTHALMLATLVLLTLAGPTQMSLAQEPTPGAPWPPIQPATGPGGAEYAYDQVVATAYGSKSPSFWLFEPAASRAGSPAAEDPLPLVVFVNGCCESGSSGTSLGPDMFWSWIEHLVRRGAVVIFPIYVQSFDTMDVVRETVGAALAELAGGGHVPVDPTSVAVLGFSRGGPTAFALTTAPPEGMSTPAALMLLAPTCCPPFRDLGSMPTTTRFLQVRAGDDDAISGVEFGAYWNALDDIPPERRADITLRSDDHGSPPLVASHFVGATEGEIVGYSAALDALDWYGTWKLLDGLMGCAFEGEWCEYAFGNTPEQRFMGVWSDGVPVNEAIVVEDPATPTS